MCHCSRSFNGIAIDRAHINIFHLHFTSCSTIYTCDIWWLPIWPISYEQWPHHTNSSSTFGLSSIRYINIYTSSRRGLCLLFIQITNKRGWRLILKSRVIAKPRDMGLALYDRSDVLQASRQKCCRNGCQNSERCYAFNMQSHGLVLATSSHDKTYRCLVNHHRNTGVSEIGP